MLTPAEKVAGRKFRDEQKDILKQRFEDDPPTYEVFFFQKIYRHLCPARGNISTALELKEKYNFSEEMEVDEQKIPAGRFGFMYKEGRCRGCGAVARSKLGMFQDAYERPPLENRIAR